MTTNHELQNPLLGQHINTILQATLNRILTALHQAGFEDIRPAHLSIFRNLVPHGLHISKLADRAGITKASVNYLVDYLQQQGYVERVPDANDGRATIIQFSERGWSAYREARTSVLGLQEEWAQLVGKNEMETFLATLAQIANSLSVTEHAEQSQDKGPKRLRGRRHTGL
ncbi:MarR family winged helix-turn-helix transcriptional regulator [Cohnella sp. REN36]|uniref:MarR family winged helix-turn-helix transcriptional regulator n=1 Tax=Cohnella sp. REN36 TaxID=2887347 RepID=UPI001D14807C|nr:MarR family transcriptional regulator [Cohnella sp. REN36]MCC3374533.1 MarR family transcriptional regulator [Cohnella sp. REN36]